MLINFIAKSICKETNNRPEKRVRNSQKNSTAVQKTRTGQRTAHIPCFSYQNALECGSPFKNTITQMEVSQENNKGDILLQSNIN